MSLWKVQKFFGDVVYDLRSRGLLPIAILLVVAMVAVPMLIARGGGGSSNAPLQAAAAATKPAPEAERAVVSYSAPGIRRSRQRLRDLSAIDPFGQRVKPPAAAAASSALSSTVPAPTSGSGSTSASVSSGSAGSSSGSSSTTTSTKHRIYYFHSVADVSFGEVSQPLQRHKNLKTYAFLPNQTAPVLVYLGSTLDRKRALFSVSKYTDQLTGDGACAPGPTDCSLLSLGPGETEEMVYAGDGKTYRVKVNGIRTQVIKPND